MTLECLNLRLYNCGCLVLVLVILIIVIVQCNNKDNQEEPKPVITTEERIRELERDIRHCKNVNFRGEECQYIDGAYQQIDDLRQQLHENQ